MSLKSESINEEDTSVEGILESIRGVMSEEDDYDFSDIDDDILDLTEIIDDGEVESESESVNDNVSSEKSILEAIDEVLAKEVAEEKPIEEQLNVSMQNIENSLNESEGLIKDKVASESSQIFNSLLGGLQDSNSDSNLSSKMTIEQLTVEAMKPLLADWLNKNLPDLVKQIVTEEIQKLVPEKSK